MNGVKELYFDIDEDQLKEIIKEWCATDPLLADTDVADIRWEYGDSESFSGAKVMVRKKGTA